MTDLTTTYLGLGLRNPLVAAASPLSKKVDNVRRLEDAGVSAVVMHSLFEEQITHEGHALDHFLTRGTDTYAEAIDYFPDLGHYNVGPDDYLDHIQALKQAVDIPVIASLNGISVGGWVEYAKRMQDAGADAIELNVYYIPTDASLSCLALEQSYVDLVRAISPTLRVPLSVKLSPFFTALPNVVQRVASAGAKGLVLFNRFYQPDFDLDELAVVPDLALSTSQELRLPLRWIAILYGRTPVDLAATTGIHTAEDVLKVMMAGANVAMVASCLIERGVEHARAILADLRQWMEDHEYESIAQMRGSMSQQSVAEPAAYERANYMKVLTSLDLKFA
jgi:dihydroorotate dehydrogenase (fumarate)